MKLRYIDLLKSVTPMKLICEKDNIPFLTSLLISNNVVTIDNAIENYFSLKSDLDNKYLVKDGTTSNSLVIKKGLEEIYLKNLTELNETEIDINITKIPPADLSDICFPPKYVNGILFMLN